jgi:hypothetical protein
MKINSRTNVGNVTSWEQLARFTSVALSDIQTAMNGNLTFSDNINMTMIDVTFSTANLVSTIPHGLGRVPLMWISGNITANSVIYQGSTADSVNLYVAASAACSARLLVI